MWHTFNLGLGFCVVIPNAELSTAMHLIEAAGYTSWVVGDIQQRDDANSPAITGLPA